MDVANVYIKNFGLLMDKMRPQIVALDVLVRGGLLSEREANTIFQRIGEYFASHMVVEVRGQPMGSVPKAVEDAFKEHV